MVSKQRLVFGHFWLFLQRIISTTNEFWIENSKMTGLKDCKDCLENVSISFAKRKLAKKINESFLMN